MTSTATLSALAAAVVLSGADLNANVSDDDFYPDSIFYVMVGSEPVYETTDPTLAADYAAHLNAETILEAVWAGEAA
jgi:hypothetical protein